MPSCLFIREKPQQNLPSEQVVYVPPPSSVFGGWARQLWLQRYFSGQIQILSQINWDQKKANVQFQLYRLTEEDGLYHEKLLNISSDHND